MKRIAKIAVIIGLVIASATAVGTFINVRPQRQLIQEFRDLAKEPHAGTYVDAGELILQYLPLGTSRAAAELKLEGADFEYFGLNSRGSSQSFPLYFHNFVDREFWLTSHKEYRVFVTYEHEKISEIRANIIWYNFGFN